MYFYNFNIGDYRSHTAHLTPTEHYIYRSLIDWYYLNERPMPANDIDYIARVLMLKTDDERQALQSVLSEFFKVKKLKLTGDTVECYHHARIDNEIKNYHHANGGRVYDHTREVTQGNITGNDVGNVKSNVCNVSGNVQNVTSDKKGNVLTQAERTAKSKAERKKIIADLQELGADFDPNADMKTLRELHGNFFGTNLGNGIGNVGNETGNVGNSESNAFHDAITNNQEPITNNQLNNSLSNADEQKTADAVLEKAEQVKQANAQDIQNWVVPTLDSMQAILFQAGFQGQLNQKDYDRHCSDFKVYFAEQAILGKPIATDSLRKNKLRDWIVRDAQKNSKPIYQKKSPQTNEQRFGTKDDPLAVDVVWNQPVVPVSQMTYEEWEAEEKAKQAARESVKIKGFEVIE